MSRKIFVLSGEDIATFEESDYTEIDLMGSKNEAALQKCVEQFPELIPADDINPSDPPTFLVVKSEAGVTPGSIDAVLIDSQATLTVLETKLYQNREIRRAVLGQALEYASYLVSEWDEETVREAGKQYWSDKGKNFDAMLSESLGVGLEDGPEFWQTVQDNLKKSRVRIIILADEVPQELRHVVDFLNRSSTFDIFAVEVKLFDDRRGTRILVPYLVGEKHPPPSATRWTSLRLREGITNELDRTRRERLTQLLELCEEIRAFDVGISQRPSFLVRNSEGKHLMTINSNGRIYVQLHPDRFATDEDFGKFFEKINRLSIFDYDRVVDTGHGRNSHGRIEELSDREFSEFKQIVRAGVQGNVP